MSSPISPGSQRATPPPGPDGLPALSGRSQRFTSIMRRVQIALLAQGFYEGAIDGVVGPSTRGALRRFQTSRGLEQTGTVTPQTLDALIISSE
jgi:His-Xaa-Ser repeat protein HxsA